MIGIPTRATRISLTIPGRVAAALLILLIVLSSSTGAGALAAGQDAAQTGLPADLTGHWAKDITARAIAAGVVRADADGRFYPDRSATRGEFAAMLVASRKVDSPPPAKPSFHDVPATSPYFAAVEAAYRLGFVEGVGGGRFAPANTLTREEATTMIVRASGREGEARALTAGQSILAGLGLTDRTTISNWAEDAVAFAVKLGIVEGFPDKSFRPQAELTRAQALALLERLASVAPLPATVIKEGDRTVHYRREIDLTATAYGEYAEDVGKWLGGPTYFGLPVREGVVAVDPTVIPLGTHLYIEGYGYAIAADVGSAIKGARVDLYLDATPQQIAEFGIQKRKAYILDGVF